MSLQKIFFSYSRIDGSDFALRLALDLKGRGFNVWIDQQDIRAGSEWDLEVEKALETCDCLLFVETEKSVSSNNVLDEVYYALGQNKKVIPLILRDSKTPFRLQRLQHIDFTKNYDSGLAHLINELKGDITSGASKPEEGELLRKVSKPFYTKYASLILIITSIVILIAAALIYAAKNKKTIHGTNDKIVNSANDKLVNSNDTIASDRELADIEPEATSKKDAQRIEEIDDKKVKIQTRNKKVNETINKEINKTDNKVENLNETFAGDWNLIDVEPKAESKRGYLKIEAIDEKKVTIKSYIQFYYFKTNDTSFLSVFNAFAGCSSCVLEKEMKITAEDVAIGSRTYKILKEDRTGEGKAGDTIMNAGANKSIRASVTLHLINNKTAVIKVQRPVAAELSHGLVLKPFVYSFRFTKTDY